MKTEKVKEEIQYVAKSGNKYRTYDFGHTKDIYKAGLFIHPMTIHGKEECISVRVTTLIEELREAGN